MPQVLNFTSSLESRRLLSKIRVAKPPERKDPNPVAWLDAIAKWDTGADCCFISRSTCRMIGLIPRIEAPVRSFAGEGEGMADIVYIDLLLDGTFIPALCVVLDSLPGADCDLLIGMSVIAQGDFSVSADRDSGKINVSFKPYPGALKHFF